MKNTKKEFKYFTVPEWKKEEDYLRQQHKSGWKFIKVTGLGTYHFEKCEPEDVIYQLDYNPDGIAHKEEYIQMFEDCGWEYLQDLFGYSYFRKPVSEMHEKDEEIFCDDSSRLDMMKRVFKGRLLPLIVMFFCIIIPQLALQGGMIHDNPVSSTLFLLFIAIFVFYVVLFASFGYKFWKYYKSTK